jgi:tetratricopeptide (TPR) repeat protein
MIRRATPFVALLLLVSTRLAAQTLQPKRALVLPTAGCAREEPAATTTRPDVAESRRLAAQGREAALVGDRRGARDAFRRAAALNPADDQVAYALGRADEELGDAAAARADYCRYLALSPTGRDAADVQQRVLRLAPPGAADATWRARDRFTAGLAALDTERWAAAAAAFDELLRLVPSTPEALFDRAIARLRLGRRDDAARDFEAYLTTAQSADDRAAVLRTLDALRRPTYSASTALGRGLAFPGLGQFYTGRPALGVVALGAVGAAVGGVLYERTVVRERTFLDAFGRPYTQPVSETERPYAVPAAAAGAAVWLLAAFEARHHAAASSPSTRRVGVAPVVGPRGGAAFAMRATF